MTVLVGPQWLFFEANICLLLLLLTFLRGVLLVVVKRMFSLMDQTLLSESHLSVGRDLGGLATTMAHPLSTDVIEEELAKLSPSSMWHLSTDGKKLTRKFTCRNWHAAMNVIHEISLIAERRDINHHPDLHLTQYRDLQIDIQTHTTGGLTILDFKLARLLDAIEIDFSPKWLFAHPVASQSQKRTQEAKEASEGKDYRL
jgi:pterin-4a-carbinolamine dehydratase